MSVLIQREPVLNRHKTITASRLRVHAASVEAAAAELARLAEAWPDSRDVFVSFVDPAMADTLLYWQPPLNVMLEVKAGRLNDAATAALISDVVGRQIPLCLDDYDPGVPLPLKPSFRFLLADANTEPDMSQAPASPLAKGLADSEAFTEAIAHGYAGAVGWLVRRVSIGLGVYAVLMALAVIGFRTVPTGFIPAQDMGYLITALQLPDGASLERTDGVVRRASQTILDTPGIAFAVAFAGFSGATRANASNAPASNCARRPSASIDAYGCGSEAGNTTPQSACVSFPHNSPLM